MLIALFAMAAQRRVPGREELQAAEAFGPGADCRTSLRASLPVNTYVCITSSSSKDPTGAMARMGKDCVFFAQEQDLVTERDMIGLKVWKIRQYT